jgi:hypothetical protein
MLSVFMGWLVEGDEVIVFEPFVDQDISNIQMTGAWAEHGVAQVRVLAWSGRALIS